MDRKDYNMEIIRLLVNYINMNPDMRFGQAIQVLGIVQNEEVDGKLYLVDNFYEESKVTYDRVKKGLAGNL